MKLKEQIESIILYLEQEFSLELQVNDLSKWWVYFTTPVNEPSWTYLVLTLLSNSKNYKTCVDFKYIDLEFRLIWDKEKPPIELLWLLDQILGKLYWANKIISNLKYSFIKPNKSIQQLKTLNKRFEIIKDIKFIYN